MNSRNEHGHTSFTSRGLTPAAKAAYWRIERRVVGHAYPQNGNVHNLTPRIRWTAYHGAKSKGSYDTLKDAVDLANGITNGTY